MTNPIRRHVYESNRHSVWPSAIAGYYKIIEVAKNNLDLMYAGERMGYSMIFNRFDRSHDNLITKKPENERKAQEYAIIDDFFKNTVLKEFKKCLQQGNKPPTGVVLDAMCQQFMRKATKNKANPQDSGKVTSFEPPSLIKFLNKMSHPLELGQHRYARDYNKVKFAKIKSEFKNEMNQEILALKGFNKDFVDRCTGSLNIEQLKKECKTAFDPYEHNLFIKQIKLFCREMTVERAEELIQVIMQDHESAIETLVTLHQNSLFGVQLKLFFGLCTDFLSLNKNLRNRWVIKRNLVEGQLKKIRDSEGQVRDSIMLQPLTDELISAFLVALGRPPLPVAPPDDAQGQPPGADVPAHVDPNAQQGAVQQGGQPAHHLLPPPTDLPPPPLPPQDRPVQPIDTQPLQPMQQPPVDPTVPKPNVQELPGDETVAQPVVQHVPGDHKATQPVGQQPSFNQPVPAPSVHKPLPALPIPKPPAMKPKIPPPNPPMNPFAKQRLGLRKVGQPPPQRLFISPQAPLTHPHNQVKHPAQEGMGAIPNLPQPVQDKPKEGVKAHATEAQTEKKTVAENKEKKQSFLGFICKPYIWLGEMVKLLFIRIFTKQLKPLKPKRK